MGVKLRSTGVRFDRLELVSEGVMREIGSKAIEEIQERTTSGRDMHGVPFQSYSEGYAKRKAAYRGEGYGAGTVNLRGIGPGGRMLNDMGITQIGKRRVVIGFRTKAKIALAFYHVVSGAGTSHVIRDFFGLSQRFLDTAVGRIKARWK